MNKRSTIIALISISIIFIILVVIILIKRNKVTSNKDDITISTDSDVNEDTNINTSNTIDNSSITNITTTEEIKKSNIIENESKLLPNQLDNKTTLIKVLRNNIKNYDDIANIVITSVNETNISITVTYNSGLEENYICGFNRDTNHFYECVLENEYNYFHSSYYKPGGKDINDKYNTVEQNTTEQETTTEEITTTEETTEETTTESDGVTEQVVEDDEEIVVIDIEPEE